MTPRIGFRKRAKAEKILLLAAVAIVLIFSVCVYRRARSQEATYSLTFSPDVRFLAKSSSEGVALFDTSTGSVIAEFGKRNRARVSFSADSKLLVIANPKSVELWDLATNSQRATFATNMRQNRLDAFTHDFKTLATASDNTVRFWDVATSRLLTTLELHDMDLTGRAFSPDDTVLAVSGSTVNSPGVKIELWDWQSGELRSEFIELEDFDVGTMVFAPDGRTLAIGFLYQTTKIWDVASGEVKGSFPGYIGQPLVFSPDGKLLAQASGYHVRIWDVATGGKKRVLRTNADWVGMAFAPSGDTLLTTGLNGIVEWWNLKTGKRQKIVRGFSIAPPKVPWLISAAFLVWMIPWATVMFRANDKEIGAPTKRKHVCRYVLPLAMLYVLSNGLLVLMYDTRDPIVFLFGLSICSIAVVVGIVAVQVALCGIRANACCLCSLCIIALQFFVNGALLVWHIKSA